jgi:hypothetical protein
VADDDEEQTIWCRTEVSPLGTYILVINYGGENVLSLAGDKLLAYCAAMADAMMRARFAEGIRRQLTERLPKSEDLGMQYAVETVSAIRDEWPTLPRFGDYSINDCVSFEGRISVQVKRGAAIIAQFAPHNVREHIAHALEVYAAADCENAYRRYLTGTIGLDAGTAGAVITDLGKHLREE